MVLGLAAWIRRERPGVKVILTSGVPGAAAMAREQVEGGAAAISHARLATNCRRQRAPGPQAIPWRKLQPA